MSLSDNLKELRRQFGFTQKRVAQMIGISQGNYSAIESGKIMPSFVTLRAINDVFEQYLDLSERVKFTYESAPLTEDEENWIKFYREMTIQERSLALGIISLFKEHKNNPYKFLSNASDYEDTTEK